LIGCGDIDEDISGVQGDLAVFRVDDWGHRKHLVLHIVNDRVDRRIPDNWKEF
jgi:hypothetical protein